jgi:hypothetical protein
MKITTFDLKTERHWRSSTGYDEQRFRKLLLLFEATYLVKFGKTLPERKADSPQKSTITSAEDLLFFTLFSLKCGLTYDLLGLVTGMDGGTANRNQELGIDILQSMLYDNNYAPRRSFETVAEFDAYFREHDTLIIDATEHTIQRPSDEYEQSDMYSGKKKDIR